MVTSTRIGSDTGGTFTDVVDNRGRSTKVLSSSSDPSHVVGVAITELLGGTILEVLTHGTTVGTNALLERNGATVGLVTTSGFADLIEIARQDRPSLYDQYDDRPEPLVKRQHRYEVVGRLDAAGQEVEAIDVDSIEVLDTEVDAVAVALLHSDLNPAHEQAVMRALVEHGHDVTASHVISPEFREYERIVTTVINAYLRPACRAYLHRLADLADRVFVMTSAGGLIPADVAAERPVDLLLSGPAGGVLAGAHVANANGWPNAITFDMGGTSTDVCLVIDGQPAPAAQRQVGGFTVRGASLDVHTIGAGGGSIAMVDSGGALVVGPRSAGATPGPVCFRRGGTEPTITDANVVAGRIPVDGKFPGIGSLDRDAAESAISRAGLTATGMLAVVDSAMEQALRAVSVERGVDPRALALVAFGGAGPLHACTLADALGMPMVIIPARAGVLSAVGILCADEQRDLVRTWSSRLDGPDLDLARSHLAAEVAELLQADNDMPAEISTSIDCRYAGQSHEITVSTIDEFHAEHHKRNGYSNVDGKVEVVAIRAKARRPSLVQLAALPSPPRPSVVGPMVLAESDCTIWVGDGWRAEPGEAGALLLTKITR